MIYLYFDKTGTLKEVINDESIRRGQTNVNGLAVYCELWDEEDFTLDDIWYCQRVSCGTLTPEVSFIDNLEIMQVPYKKDVDYTYFKDYKQYKFYVFEFTTEYTQYSGLNVGTVRFAVDDGINALGTITFNIQDNVIKEDNNITQSQYDYLLLSYASRTLNEETGRTLCELIEDIVKEQAKITGIEYVGTTEEILALTSDVGIALSTTNAHIYNWDAEQGSYVDSGIEFMDVSLSSNVMTLSGSQTVSGAKTFTGTQTFDDTLQAKEIKGKNDAFKIKSKNGKAIININDESNYSEIVFQLSADGLLFSPILTFTANNGDFIADFNGSKVFSAILNNCQSDTTPTNAKDLVNKSYADAIKTTLETALSNKADLVNPNQEMEVFDLTAENIYVADIFYNDAQITMNSAFGGISFKPNGSNKTITIGAGQIKGVDTVSNNTDATNKQYVDTIKTNLQSQIDGINAGQNLADIVADLTALNNLSTTNLQVGDKVQVLVDSDHDDGSTVYNWNGTTWVYIGKYGQDGYTKAQADTLFATKQELSNIKDGTTIDSFADVETALSGKVDMLQADWADQVYVKKSDGTNSSYYIDFNSTPYSVCIRNATGRLNVVGALYDSQAINLGQWKNDLQVKRHFINATINDGTSNITAIITILSPIASLNTATLIKDYFKTKGYNIPSTSTYLLTDVSIFIPSTNNNYVGVVYDETNDKFIANGTSYTLVSISSETITKDILPQ